MIVGSSDILHSYLKENSFISEYQAFMPSAERGENSPQLIYITEF